jgi:hypothetical protein
MDSNEPLIKKALLPLSIVFKNGGAVSHVAGFTKTPFVIEGLSEPRRRRERAVSQ